MEWIAGVLVVAFIAWLGFKRAEEKGEQEAIAQITEKELEAEARFEQAKLEAEKSVPRNSADFINWMLNPTKKDNRKK